MRELISKEGLANVAESIDRLINVDIGARGTAQVLFDAARELLGGKPMTLAAVELIQQSVHPGDYVFITTGWADQPSNLPTKSETDGPPGTAALARAIRLTRKGLPVVITDDYLVEDMKKVMSSSGFSIVEPEDLSKSLSDELGFTMVPTISVIGMPIDQEACRIRSEELLDRYKPSLCLAIERGGMNKHGRIHGMGGFDFSADDGDKADWKIYEGSTNPLLKVFLTKVTISDDTDLGLVYNGKEQDIDLDDFTSHDGISAADGFAAYENNNDLIQNTDFEHKNADSYSDWLYSGQIATGTGEDGFNPNNLGYDIDFVQDIDKAQITISLDEIHRDYGSSVIKDGGSYGFSFDNADETAGLTEEMKNELASIVMDEDSIRDGAVEDLADGKTTTNNAGTYEWSAEFSLGENTGKDSLANNYELVSAEGTAGSKVTVLENKSIVDRVQLTIDLNDVNRVYGDTAITNGSYGIENVTGLVNGDEAKKDSLTLADNADIKDGALSEDKTKTNDVKDGGYSWNVSGEDDAGKAQNFTGIDDLATNYDITIKDGSSMIDQKEISVGDLGASIVYGNQDGKGLVIHGDLGLTGIVYNDDVSLSGDASYTTGGSYDTNKGGRGTADVGTYEDSLFVGGLTLSGEKTGNYKLVTNEAVGDIEVTKANLTITVDNAETTYGTAFDSSKYGYTLGGIVNGDTEDALKGDIGNVTYTNSAAKDGANDVWTDNAGTYDDAVGIDRDTLGELSNYEITTVTNGDAVVNRREISIGSGSHDIYVGENEPTYTGTDIQGQLVNGDMISDGFYQYGPETSVDTNVTGEHTIGIHFVDGSYLHTSGQSAWDAVMNGLFQNYTVKFTPGKLTISDMPVDMPSEGEHWNFLFDDNPWDRNRDFRERKAEVHFVAGGMTL